MDILTCTAHHPLRDGSVDLLGAVSAVTGAMTRVNCGGARFLVDAGRPQGADARHWRFPDRAMEIDALVLTHGHNDHVGSLPEMLARGFRKPIFGTRPTLDLAALVVADGMRLSGADPRDIDETLRQLRALFHAVDYDAPAQGIPQFAGTFALREAGHILGSASVEFRSAESRVICSGDLGRPGTPLLRDPNRAWASDAPADVVVLESTYGDSDHGHVTAELADRLQDVVLRALKDGGHILVPAFAIGRTQTLLYLFNELVESGRIPRIPVAVDSPMGLEVTELHQAHRELFDAPALAKLAAHDNPLDFKNLYAVRRTADSFRIHEVRESMLVIAGSGMCTGGRIVNHLKALLPRPETCVLFVGYQADGTPGRRIQDAARTHATVQLDGADVPVRAAVETLPGMSAHADRSELRAWLSAIPRVQRVALHHGEPGAQRALAEFLQR
ncbi:MAG: MBL fold metallo-hydrolase [Deltaproteobacteria bacterium]|nr:MBL fold metallo-hydrolase [Deltaproteobacteria bacterium]